jgi:clorobiocin biosynthesis protein CloN5
VTTEQTTTTDPASDAYAARADRIAAHISAFIRDTFLDGDPRGELEETTPLLEWGVLNSLRMTQLLAFLREGLPETERAKVPALQINAQNFKNVKTIAALVDRLTCV